MAAPDERTSITVDAVQRGWSIHQSDMATVFGYEGHQLVVRWSDNGVATAGELRRGDTVVTRRDWFPDREVGAWVREQLAAVPWQEDRIEYALLWNVISLELTDFCARNGVTAPALSERNRVAAAVWHRLHPFRPLGQPENNGGVAEVQP
ncbi:hypothetical protein [Nocardia farcinica]|uniref:hypothetical protein n=1 Tax=Nocardia farcinica TaxID=37329 RepID=UPI0024578532|nr:hypothetical protein [Nocardia farcinica]